MLNTIKHVNPRHTVCVHFPPYDCYAFCISNPVIDAVQLYNQTIQRHNKDCQILHLADRYLLDTGSILRTCKVSQ